LEETGINLVDCSCFVGVLEPLGSTQKPEMKILPFIVFLECEPPIVLNEELERFVWIPIQKLKRSRGFFKTDLGNLPAYVVGNDIIWGLTYRIIERFMEIVGG
jgi:8-oxo-dGTP pyrophosphatase MutT (NUDIX family)